MMPGVLMMKKSQIAVLVLIVALAGAGFAFYKCMPLSLYKYLPFDAEYKDCAECPAIVEIPPGTFMMGSPDTEPDHQGYVAIAAAPVHRVTIPASFAAGKYEVTFDEWDACVAAGGCSHKPGDEGWGRGRHPVMNVSWNDVQTYLVWLSNKTGKTYRLLSEAEWEYVARAGTTTPFHTGATISTSQANFNVKFTYPPGKRDRTVPVGSFGANQFGLHDVHGNVWEWVQDCLNENYKGAPSDGSAWAAGGCGERILRGGSWFFRPRALRSSERYWYRSDDRDSIGGFRVARTLP
jgi:formylglycine-generating enzyme required for sulfatase activity